MPKRDTEGKCRDCRLKRKIDTHRRCRECWNKRRNDQWTINDVVNVDVLLMQESVAGSAPLINESGKNQTTV